MKGYTSQVFQDARMFSEHAGRADVDLDDLKLAIQSKVNISFTQPPPREVRTLFRFISLYFFIY